MATRVSRETTPPATEPMPELPMTRVHARRVNPIDITPRVQMFALACLTLVILSVLGTLAGA
jgi:hypothetical protein